MGAIMRADRGKIKLGFCSNIQDRAVVTCADEMESPDVQIGNYVTIGPGASISSCVVEDGTCIGMNAVVQDGSIIESKAAVAAGSVVTSGTLIPTGQYWAGNPAVFVRKLSDEEIQGLQVMAEGYARLATEHKDEFYPMGLYTNKRNLWIEQGTYAFTFFTSETIVHEGLKDNSSSCYPH